MFYWFRFFWFCLFVCFWCFLWWDSGFAFWAAYLVSFGRLWVLQKQNHVVCILLWPSMTCSRFRGSWLCACMHSACPCVFSLMVGRWLRCGRGRIYVPSATCWYGGDLGLKFRSEFFWSCLCGDPPGPLKVREVGCWNSEKQTCWVLSPGFHILPRASP